MRLSHCRNLSSLALIACLSACTEADHTVWLSPLNVVISDNQPGWRMSPFEEVMGAIRYKSKAQNLSILW